MSEDLSVSFSFLYSYRSLLILLLLLLLFTSAHPPTLGECVLLVLAVGFLISLAKHRLT